MKEKDKLKSLFQEMELNEPSWGFEDRLMAQIQHVIIERDKKRLQKKKIYSWLSVSLAIASIFVLPVLVLWLAGWNITQFSETSFSIPVVEIPSSLVMIFGTALLLLVADLFIRKNAFDRKYNRKNRSE